MKLIELNSKKLISSLIGSIAVISGVVIKNSFEQIDKSDHVIATAVGPLLFIVGWLVVAQAISFSGNKTFFSIPPKNLKTLVSFASSIAIVAGVMNMKRIMATGGNLMGFNIIFPLLFVLGWFGLGYVVGNDMISYLIPIMVILSMMVLLPQQRKNGVVDGLGMQLFVGAWALLIFKNSM